MTNTFSKMEDAPMHFNIKEGKTDCKTIKVSCSDVNGNVCKANGRGMPTFGEVYVWAT